MARKLRSLASSKRKFLWENAKVVSSFVVVKYGRCILGNATAKELAVFHIGPKARPIGGSSNEVKSDFADQLKFNTLKCSRELAN